MTRLPVMDLDLYRRPQARREPPFWLFYPLVLAGATLAAIGVVGLLWLAVLIVGGGL